MRPFAFVAALTLAVGLVGSVPAIASTTNTAGATPVAMGCGVGLTRDARGHCRRRFDLFRRYSQFNAFKSRNCKRVMTPDGRVGYCRI